MHSLPIKNKWILIKKFNKCNKLLISDFGRQLYYIVVSV